MSYLELLSVFRALCGDNPEQNAGTIHAFNPKHLPIFAMVKIGRISHDHQAPFWHVVLRVVDVSSGEAKLKPAATCTIHLGPPIFLQIMDPL